MKLVLLILVAISLSMDAFSLSLAYGTLNLSKKNIILITIIVGVFHFFMPLLGMNVGRKIIQSLIIKPETLVFMILFLIGTEMIIESFKEKEIRTMHFIEMLLFGLSVSLDSFSIGFGLKTLYENYIIGPILFSLTSAFFTFLGLNLGKKINNKIGSFSTFLGGIFLIVISFIYLM